LIGSQPIPQEWRNRYLYEADPARSTFAPVSRLLIPSTGPAASIRHADAKSMDITGPLLFMGPGFRNNKRAWGLTHCHPVVERELEATA
jgi:hypothetical protein